MKTFHKNIIHRLNQTSEYNRELMVMVRALVRFHWGTINVDKTGQALRGEYSNISGMSPSILPPSSMFLKRKSIEFHDMRMECQRIIIIIHFLLCSLFWSLTDHSHPNFLSHKSLTSPSLAPLSLATKISFSYLSLPHCSRALTHLFPGLIMSNLLHD